MIFLLCELFYTYSEKRLRTPTFQSTVRYLGLFREIGGVLDRCYHPLDRQKRGQIRGVRRDDDQCEEPPYAAYYSCTSSLIMRFIISFSFRINLISRFFNQSLYRYYNYDIEFITIFNFALLINLITYIICSHIHFSF